MPKHHKLLKQGTGTLEELTRDQVYTYVEKNHREDWVFVTMDNVTVSDYLDNLVDEYNSAPYSLSRTTPGLRLVSGRHIREYLKGIEWKQMHIVKDSVLGLHNFELARNNVGSVLSTNTEESVRKLIEASDYNLRGKIDWDLLSKNASGIYYNKDNLERVGGQEALNEQFKGFYKEELFFFPNNLRAVSEFISTGTISLAYIMAIDPLARQKHFSDLFNKLTSENANPKAIKDLTIEAWKSELVNKLPLDEDVHLESTKLQRLTSGNFQITTYTETEDYRFLKWISVKEISIANRGMIDFDKQPWFKPYLRFTEYVVEYYLGDSAKMYTMDPTAILSEFRKYDYEAYSLLYFSYNNTEQKGYTDIFGYDRGTTTYILYGNEKPKFRLGDWGLELVTEMRTYMQYTKFIKKDQGYIHWDNIWSAIADDTNAPFKVMHYFFTSEILKDPSVVSFEIGIQSKIGAIFYQYYINSLIKNNLLEDLRGTLGRYDLEIDNMKLNSQNLADTGDILEGSRKDGTLNGSTLLHNIERFHSPFALGERILRIARGIGPELREYYVEVGKIYSNTQLLNVSEYDFHEWVMQQQYIENPELPDSVYMNNPNFEYHKEKMIDVLNDIKFNKVSLSALYNMEVQRVDITDYFWNNRAKVLGLTSIESSHRRIHEKYYVIQIGKPTWADQYYHSQLGMDINSITSAPDSPSLVYSRAGGNLVIHSIQSGTTKNASKSKYLIEMLLKKEAEGLRIFDVGELTAEGARLFNIAMRDFQVNDRWNEFGDTFTTDKVQFMIVGPDQFPDDINPMFTNLQDVNPWDVSGEVEIVSYITRSYPVEWLSGRKLAIQQRGFSTPYNSPVDEVPVKLTFLSFYDLNLDLTMRDFHGTVYKLLDSLSWFLPKRVSGELLLSLDEWYSIAKTGFEIVFPDDINDILNRKLFFKYEDAKFIPISDRPTFTKQSKIDPSSTIKIYNYGNLLSYKGQTDIPWNSLFNTPVTETPLGKIQMTESSMGEILKTATHESFLKYLEAQGDFISDDQKYIIDKSDARFIFPESVPAIVPDWTSSDLYTHDELMREGNANLGELYKELFPDAMPLTKEMIEVAIMGRVLHPKVGKHSVSGSLSTDLQYTNIEDIKSAAGTWSRIFHASRTGQADPSKLSLATNYFHDTLSPLVKTESGAYGKVMYDMFLGSIAKTTKPMITVRFSKDTRRNTKITPNHTYSHSIIPAGADILHITRLIDVIGDIFGSTATVHYFPAGTIYFTTSIMNPLEYEVIMIGADMLKAPKISLDGYTQKVFNMTINSFLYNPQFFLENSLTAPFNLPQERSADVIKRRISDDVSFDNVQAIKEALTVAWIKAEGNIANPIDSKLARLSLPEAVKNFRAIEETFSLAPRIIETDDIINKIYSYESSSFDSGRTYKISGEYKHVYEYEPKNRRILGKTLFAVDIAISAYFMEDIIKKYNNGVLPIVLVSKGAGIYEEELYYKHNIVKQAYYQNFVTDIVNIKENASAFRIELRKKIEESNLTKEQKRSGWESFVRSMYGISDSYFGEQIGTPEWEEQYLKNDLREDLLDSDAFKVGLLNVIGIGFNILEGISDTLIVTAGMLWPVLLEFKDTIMGRAGKAAVESIPGAVNYLMNRGPDGELLYDGPSMAIMMTPILGDMIRTELLMNEVEQLGDAAIDWFDNLTKDLQVELIEFLLFKHRI